MQQQSNKHQKEIEQLKKEIALLKDLMPSNAVEALRIEDNDEFKLEKNIPNPFKKQTTIKYYVPNNEAGRISIFVVDDQGKQQLFFDHLKSGNQQIQIENHHLAIGFYFYSLVVDGDVKVTRKMEVVR